MFPYAIQFGMSNYDFWYNEPSLYWAYQVAYQDKAKRDLEIMNYNAWLCGLYNYNAFSVVEANVNRRETDELQSYVNKPFDFSDKDNNVDDKKEKKNMLEIRMKALLSKSKSILGKKKEG